MPRWRWRATLLLPLLAGLVAFAPQTEKTGSLPIVRVENGPHAFDEVSVSVALPRGLPGEHFQLRHEDGSVTVTQVTRDRQLAFVLRQLAPGERREYRLEPALDRPHRDGAEADRQFDRVDLRLAGRSVLSYRSEKTAPPPDVSAIYRRGGYIHPVLTPQGRTVTDDYPPNHLHHHGIWFAWTRTEFQGRTPDFWNMGDGTGTVEFEALLDTWSGPLQAGLRTRHRFVDLSAPTPVTVLTEIWDVTLHALGRSGRPYRAFDLVSTQELATTSPLVLPEYRYGGIGLRGHRSWLGANGVQFLTSEGKTRVDGHGTRARWCAMSGLVRGQRIGIAVFDHPSNERHPQSMRIHPTEPFFNFAPMQLGAMTLTPDRAYVSRYRFITFDGAPDAAWLDRLWNAYARPPVVTVG